VGDGDVALRIGTTYRFAVKGPMTACLHDAVDVLSSQTVSRSGYRFGCACRGILTTTVLANASTGAAMYLHIENGPVIALPIVQRNCGVKIMV